MTSLVTVIITSTLVLLFELEFPFRSWLGVDGTDWSRAIEHIQYMISGSGMGGMRM
jgi:hypothetical protein